MEKLFSLGKKESDVFKNNFLQHDYPLRDKFQTSDDIDYPDDSPLDCMHSNSIYGFSNSSSRPVNNTTPAISDRFSCKSKMSSVRPNDSNSVAWSWFNTNGLLNNERYFGFRGSDAHSEVPTSAAVMKKRLGQIAFLSDGLDAQFEPASASVINGRTQKTFSVSSNSLDESQVSEPHPILGRWSKDKSVADNLMEDDVVKEGSDDANVSLVVGQPWSQRHSDPVYKSTIEMVHPAECYQYTDIPSPKFGAMNTESSYFNSGTMPSSFKNNPRSQWQDFYVPNNNGMNDASSYHTFIPNVSSFSPAEKSHFKCREYDFNSIYDNATFVYPERCHCSLSHSDRRETSSLTGKLFHDLNICSRSDFQDLTLVMLDFLKARGGFCNESEQSSLHCKQPRNGEVTSCAFCKRNGETLEFYSTHVVKDNRGKVICPILRKYVCPLCDSTGDKAHTIRHCPLYSGNPINTAFDTFATKRSSFGHRSRNNSY